MAYSPTNWQTGDTITATLLNHAEQGISDNDTAISTEASERASADNTLDGKIGTLSSLNTTTKSNLVSAVNEVNTPITNAQIDALF